MFRQLAFLLFMMAMAGPACAWNLVLPDSVSVRGPDVRLGEIAIGPLPTAVKDLLVQNGRRPGTVESISRRMILRRLVSSSLAAGVRLQGAETCRVFTSGQEIPATDLVVGIRSVLQDLVPRQRAGAPVSWFELQVPDIPINLSGDPLITAKEGRPLEAGRNQVWIRIETGGRTQEVPVGVVLHSFAETAIVKRAIGRGVVLDEDLFTWEWKDLAFESGEQALNREAVLGFSSSRSLSAGETLRPSDLKPTPLVRVGDPVELMIFRGRVSATVRAFARQAGCLGQTIPVRNELTGRLVNARVAGPGLVEWRK